MTLFLMLSCESKHTDMYIKLQLELITEVLSSDQLFYHLRPCLTLKLRWLKQLLKVQGREKSERVTVSKQDRFYSVKIVNLCFPGYFFVHS